MAAPLYPTSGVLAGMPPRPATLNIPTSPTLTAPTAPTFTRRAPTPTPYGDFVAPNPADIANDPGYQFRSAEGEKAIQRSAAAHGTLLSGGTLKSLERYRQGIASDEAGKAFDRALAAYTTNRGTNAQNFDQQMGAFGGDLNAFGANTNAGLGYGRLGLDTAQYNDANAWRTAEAQQANQQGVNDYTAAEQDRASSDYARQVDEARRLEDEQRAAAAAIRPAAPTRSPLARRELR